MDDAVIDRLGAPSRLINALLDPNRAVPLREGELHQVPRTPGLYAIWLLEPGSLRACGIDGPAPKLIYIGMASPRHGLRGRLYQHLGADWGALTELLAVRGHVLFPWWAKQWPEWF